MGLDVDQFSLLVDLIYAAATDPAGWDEVTRALAQTFDAAYGLIFGFDPRTSVVSHATGWGLPAAVLEPYATTYAALDVRMPAALQAPAGSVLTDASLIDARAYRASTIYNEYLHPLALERIMAVLPYNSGGRQAIISVNRADARGAFDATEQRFLARLVPHFQRALLISEKLGRAERDRAVADELGSKSQFGAIYLGPAGRIVAANPVAQDLLASQTLLRSNDGYLVAVGRATNDALQQAIMAAERLTCDREGAAPAVVRANSGEAEPSYLLVAPLGGGRMTLDDDAAVMTVFVFPGSRRPHIAPLQVQRVYGVTASEARVVARLVSGATIAEVAAQASISVETVRTHVKRSLTKLHCESQAALVRKVLLGPVPLLSMHD